MANGADLDSNTLTGKVRLTVGDDVTDAAGDYSFSDEAIAAALAISGNNVARAAGTLVRQLALQASLAGQSIKADDFSINTSGRGKSLLDVAQSYFDQANVEDAIASQGELTIAKTTIRPYEEETLLSTSSRRMRAF